MPTKGFVWVNKDITSDILTRAEGSEKQHIRRHVQKGLLRPRKAKAKASGNHLPGTQSALSPVSYSPELYDPVVRSIVCTPFQAGPVHIDSVVRRLLQYYIHCYHPTIWTYSPSSRPAFAMLQEPYVFKKSNAYSVTTIVNRAVQDGLLMHCLLSAAASRLENIDIPHTFAADQLQHRYKQKALSLLKARVLSADTRNQAVKADLVQCITFLGAAASYRDEYEEARMHLRAALALLRQGGGLSQLQDENVRGQVQMMDLYLACVDLKPCECAPDYDPGPAFNLSLSDHELYPLEQSKMASALLEGCDDFVLSPPLRELVLRIRESYIIKIRLNWDNVDSARGFEISHWVTKRNMAIRNRLLAIEACNAPVHALRVALIMWTLLAMNITGRVKTVKTMASRLECILRRIAPDNWKGNAHVRLWILLTGYSCAEENSEEWQWFVEEIRWLFAGVLSPAIVQDDLLAALAAFQHGFFYHTPVQHDRTEHLAGLLSSTSTLWWEDVILARPAANTEAKKESILNRLRLSV